MYNRNVSERKPMHNTTHCQICARDIKANTGTIAHHGYQRPGNGYQTSSCLGAKFLPYEQSRDRIPQVRDIYKGYLEFNKERLKDTLNNPPAELTETMRYSFHEPQTYTRPENFNKEKAMAQGSFSHTNDDMYAMEYRRLVKNIRQNIAGLTHEIDFLQERYDNWKGVK